MSIDPELQAALDKEFGSPPLSPFARPSDKSEATPEAPALIEESENPEEPETETPEESAIDPSVILMREDYSRKMHEVGTQRRAIEAERAKIETQKQELSDLYALREKMQADPGYRERILQAEAEYESERGPSPVAPAPIDRQTQSRIERLERIIAEQTESAFVERFRQDMSRVSKEHGLTKEQTDQMVAHAVKTDLVGFRTPLELIYDRLDLVAAKLSLPKAKANGQREMLDQIETKKRAASPATERKIAPEPEPDVSKMKEQDFEAYLVKKIERELGAS